MGTFEFKSKSRIYTDDELSQALINAAMALSHTPSMREFNEGNFGPSGNTISNRFGTWNQALNQAGLSPGRVWRYSDEDLYESLLNAWVKIGKQPSRTDYQSAGEISSSAIENRFGSWNGAMKAFVVWANNNDRDVDISDQDSHIAPSRNTNRNPSLRLRFNVFKRDHFSCASCGKRPPEVELEVDHVIPWSKGGETVESNLQSLCNRCNRGKSNYCD